MSGQSGTSEVIGRVSTLLLIRKIARLTEYAKSDIAISGVGFGWYHPTITST